MATKFGQKNPSPKYNTNMGSKAMQELARGQIAPECLMATKFGRRNP